MDKLMSADETYFEVENVGKHKTKKRFATTITNGIFAGIFIALGGFAAAAGSHAIDNFSIARLISGMIFPVGLILTIFCGAELFTGNILICVAVFEKKIKLRSMLRNWTLVYIGNMIGAVIIGLLIGYSGMLDSNSGSLGGYVLKAATQKVNLEFTEVLIRGILCNILVCMAVWGSYSTNSTAGKFLTIHITILAFIVSGFEHSIANMYYLTVGVFAKAIPEFVELSHVSAKELANLNANGIINNLIPATIGNIIGGVVFVGFLYWVSHRGAEIKILSNDQIEQLKQQ